MEELPFYGSEEVPLDLRLNAPGRRSVWVTCNPTFVPHTAIRESCAATVVEIDVQRMLGRLRLYDQLGLCLWEEFIGYLDNTRRWFMSNVVFAAKDNFHHKSLIVLLSVSGEHGGKLLFHSISFPIRWLPRTSHSESPSQPYRNWGRHSHTNLAHAVIGSRISSPAVIGPRISSPAVIGLRISRNFKSTLIGQKGYKFSALRHLGQLSF